MSASLLSALEHRAKDNCGEFHLSRYGLRVGPSRFSAGPLQEAMRQPGAHVLAQGVPPACILPLKAMSLTLSDGSTIDFDAAESFSAQRYAPFAWGGLRSWLVDHIRVLHSPPTREEWSVSISPGSMYSLDCVMRLLLDPGDALLCEEYTFMATKDLFGSLDATVLPLAMDAHGLIPSSVEVACQTRAAAGLPAPKLLYIIPVGQNPTGTCLAPERYAAIYNLARQYGFVIVEDE